MRAAAGQAAPPTDGDERRASPRDGRRAERCSSTLLRTVDGPLAPERVRGPVLAHEHLALDLSGLGDEAAVLDGRHRASVTCELGALREEFGLSLVVELTCRGMGRDAAALARIARESGVAVVAGTGWYYERFHPRGAAHAGVEELAGELIREIDGGPGGGIDGTGVRPGVIGEAGSHGDAPSGAEVRTLTAAALAARSTGLSVATHAQLGRGGPAQLELLTGAGLPPHRLSIGHQDLLDDPGVHRELAAAGAYVAFDTVGKESYQSDGTRLRLLVALLEAGHGDRALLSCDVSRHGYLTSEGGSGYGHLFRSFLPRLRAAGADDDLIDLLTRRNPLRFLTGGAYDGETGSAEASETDVNAAEAYAAEAIAAEAYAAKAKAAGASAGAARPQDPDADAPDAYDRGAHAPDASGAEAGRARERSGRRRSGADRGVVR